MVRGRIGTSVGGSWDLVFWFLGKVFSRGKLAAAGGRHVGGFILEMKEKKKKKKKE